MKKTKVLLALIVALTACKKEQKPVVAGGTYRVKGDIFNRGTFQPLDTLYAYSIYFNNAEGLFYCRCGGPSTGTPLGTGKVDSLNSQPLWFIPTDDLK